MSRASNSKKSTNVSNLSATASDTSAISSVTTRGKKRIAPFPPPEGQIKKAMIDQHSSAEQVSNDTSNGNNQLRFVSATEIAVTDRSKIQMISELSDEELLEMAIKLEKEYPQ